MDAATQAVQRGETPPTIEDAAEAAGVSRATAHLYFTSQQSLLLKALLDVMGTIPDPSLVDEGPVESRVDARYPFPCADGVRPRTRPAHLSNAFLGAVAAHPPEEQRELPLRKGRRIAWLDRALAPLKSLSPPPEVPPGDGFDHAVRGRGYDRGQRRLPVLSQGSGGCLPMGSPGHSSSCADRFAGVAGSVGPGSATVYPSARKRHKETG